jgi:hypothetical protein
VLLGGTKLAQFPSKQSAGAAKLLRLAWPHPIYFWKQRRSRCEAFIFWHGIILAGYSGRFVPLILVLTCE